MGHGLSKRLKLLRCALEIRARAIPQVIQDY